MTVKKDNVGDPVYERSLFSVQSYVDEEGATAEDIGAMDLCLELLLRLPYSLPS